MFRLQFRVLIVCCVAGSLDFCSNAWSQVVQGPGRPNVDAAVAFPGQIEPGGMVFDRRGGPGAGRRSGVRVVVPGPMPSSRRGGVRGYAGAQYSVPQVDSPSNMRVRTYSSPPHRANYSVPPVPSYTVPPVYNYSSPYGGGYPDVHHEIQSGATYPGHIHPYDQARIGRGQPIRYPPGYGPRGGGIVAPAVVSPYGGLSGVEIPGPAPHSFPPPIPVPYPAVPILPEDGTSVSPVMPVDRLPIADEFPIKISTEQQAEVGVVEFIRSLRSQTTGDMAFRRRDYTSAESHYKTAAESAPSRRASWLRLAWAQLAQQRFSDAAVSLKSAMHLDNDDHARAWISGGLLFGDGVYTAASVQNDLLWKWLQERPNSTDRLMLTAAFQHLLGYTGVAQELLAVASKNGLPDTLHGEMRKTFSETHHNRDLNDLPAFAVPPSTVNNAGTVDAPGAPVDVERTGSQDNPPNPANPDVLTLPDPGRPAESENAPRSSVPAIPPALSPTPQDSESPPAILPGNTPQTPIPD
jgi:hypothetical protein